MTAHKEFDRAKHRYRLKSTICLSIWDPKSNVVPSQKKKPKEKEVKSVANRSTGTEEKTARGT